MKQFLNEEDQIYSEAHNKELLNLQVAYNNEIKTLNDKYAKKRADLNMKYFKMDQQAKEQAAQKQTAAKTAGTQQPTQTQTGTVDKAGTPTTAKGTPATSTVESMSILRKRNINEEKFDTSGVEPEELQNLKDYLDSELIPYEENEDQTYIKFDKDEADEEWQASLEDLGFEEEDDDEILTVEPEKDEEEIEDEEAEDEEPEDKETEEQELSEDDKVFYVSVTDNGETFVGKLYKLFDDGEWRSKVVDGESETFEKLNYDPDWDEYDVVAFLRENYDEAEVISEKEFNQHVEFPEEPVGEHKIESFEDFLNEEEHEEYCDDDKCGARGEYPDMCVCNKELPEEEVEETFRGINGNGNILVPKQTESEHKIPSFEEYLNENS